MISRMHTAPSLPSCRPACSARSNGAPTAGAAWSARAMTAGFRRNGSGGSIRTKRWTERAAIQLFSRGLGALYHLCRRCIDSLQQLLDIFAPHQLNLDPLFFRLLQEFRIRKGLGKGLA